MLNEETKAEIQAAYRAVLAGKDLRHLREAVEKEFKTLTEQERDVRSVMTKLETGLIRRLAEFQHE